MRKKGFTLIEIMISLCILSILVLITFNFVLYNDKNYSSSGKGIDESINLRIGLEFLVNQIASADRVELIDLSGTVNAIKVTSISSYNPGVYLKITYGADVDKVYILRNILRYNTASEQIVSGIESFSIEDRGRGLYKISISSESQTLSTLIYRRK